MRSKATYITGFGLILLALHAGTLLVLHEGRTRELLSNLLQLVASLAAAGMCAWAAAQARNQTRHFWLLSALSIGLWSLGQGIWMREEFRFGVDQPGPAPTDVFFFFAFTPLLMAMLLREESHEPGIDWTRVLDAIQVVILMMSAYLFLFALPHHMQSQEEFYTNLLRFVFNARNIFITIAFIGRYLLSENRNTKTLYGRLAAFLVVYTVATGITNYLRAYFQFRTGRLSDLGWTVPFIFCAVLVAYWKEEPGPPAFHEPMTGMKVLISVYLIPTLVPFGVVAMAAHITPESPFLAYLAIFTTFAAYSARLAVTQIQQKRTEAALRQSEERFRLLAENAPGLIYLCHWDRHFSDVYLNDHTLELTGYPKEDFLSGKINFTELYHPDDVESIFAETERGLKERRPFRLRYRLRHKSGTWRTVDDVGIGIYKNNEVELIEGFISDVTERKNLEEQLRQSQKMEAVGTLAGGVAHDFNNLLTVISGYTRLLLDQFGDDATVGGQLHQVARAADRAASLTAQLLAFSRRQVLLPRQVSLNEIFTGLEPMLHRVIGENIAIKKDLDPALYLVKADAGQIEQVVMNLASNARDAMAAGGSLRFATFNTFLHPDTALELGVSAGDFACLQVEDSGQGIDAETLPHIFEPFFTTKEEKGTGLGLSTVYGIIKQSQGGIQVESSASGTTFKMYFPKSEAVMPEPVSTAPPLLAKKGWETILLVEDDAELRELVKRILSMQGYQVLTAARGTDAIQIVKDVGSKIKLLITDVIMPGMSGKELAQKITAHVPRLQVLFISGYTDNIIAEQGILEAGTSFLQKPFSPATLIGKVREILDLSSINA